MTATRNYMSNEEKSFALELFKAHYTAKEAASYFSFGYATLRNLWRGFEFAEIKKYNRMELIETNKLLKDYINAQTG